MTSEELMRRAVARAEENVRSGSGGPFAALVARNGVILGEGANEVTATNDPTAHAEIVAIRAACRTLGSFRLAGCEIYTTCEPCPMCLGAVYWARLDRLYFAADRADAEHAGFDDGFIYRELAASPNARSLPMLRLLPEPARAVLELWRLTPEKVPY